MNPSRPFAIGDRAGGRIDPESRCAGPERAVEKRERAFWQTVPQQIAIELGEAGRKTLRRFDLFGRAQFIAQ